MKKIGDITVNNGKGLFDNEGLCESLINDCNNLMKYSMSCQYILFCSTIVQMVQKLNNLKKGIKADLESKDKIISELTEMNDALVEKQTGLPVERG